MGGFNPLAINEVELSILQAMRDSNNQLLCPIRTFKDLYSGSEVIKGLASLKRKGLIKSSQPPIYFTKYGARFIKTLRRAD